MCEDTLSGERFRKSYIKWILGPYSNVMGCSIGLVPILVLEYQHGTHRIWGGSCHMVIRDDDDYIYYAVL